jgi:hypothetical protein
MAELEQQLADVKCLLPADSAPTVFELEDELAEVKELFAQKLGDFVSNWSIARGAVPSMAELEQQLRDVKCLLPADSAPSVFDLEDELAAMKALFEAKFGDVVKDWSVTRGAVPCVLDLEQQLADVKCLLPADSAPTVYELEDELAEVKELFDGKFGDVVDDWLVQRGAAPSVSALELQLREVQMLLPEFTCPQMDDLEDDLASVKQLFASQFGDIVDDWAVTRGAAPTMESLEQQLLELKLLHEPTLGAAAIEKSSGVMWAVSRGVTPDIPTIDSLDAELQAVKAIFLAKFGSAAESEESED